MSARPPDYPALEAERSLIGALLLDGVPVADVVRIVSRYDFAEPRHGHLFEAVRSVHARGEPIDFVTVGKELDKTGRLAEAGGLPYMVELAQGVTTTTRARHHAGVVANRGRHQRAVALLRRGAGTLEGEPPDRAVELLGGLIAELHVLAAPAAGQGIDTVRISDVESRPVTWLWPGRIALGKLTLLVGDPGLGKSTLALDVAARVTRGAKMPDGSDSPAGQVLILSAEDGLEDTVRPRLEAADAVLERVHAVRAVRGREGERSFSLEEDLRDLDRKAGEIEGLRLIVIDPVTAFMGMTDSHKNADVRRVLAPLGALAERHRIAVLAISHLTKAQGPALYRALGSVAFVAAARAAWFVTKDKQDKGRRLFVQGKNNLGDAKALAFRVTVGTGAEPSDVPRIDWEPDPVSITADEALAPEASAEGGELGRACAWLHDELASGPIEALTVIRDAADNGFSKKTLYRAKEKLGVCSKKVGTRGSWTWELEGAQGAQPQGLATLGGLGHLGPGGPNNGVQDDHLELEESQGGQLSGEAILKAQEERAAIQEDEAGLERVEVEREHVTAMDAGEAERPCIERCGSCGEPDFVRPRAGGTWRCARCRPYEPGTAVECWPRFEGPFVPLEEVLK